MVKNMHANEENANEQEMGYRSLDREDSPKEEMAAHSSILAQRTAWAEEPDGL